MTDREREARIRERAVLDREAFENCIRALYAGGRDSMEKADFALQRHDAAQRAEIERYREALPLLDFIREADEAGFWWQIGGPGHYTDEGLGPQRDCVTIAASPHGRYFDPGNGGFIARGETLAEAADRAHRALNDGEDDG